MANVSHARKAGIAARIVAQQVGRSRTFGAVKTGVRTSATHMGRAVHQLWIEVTGFSFLAFSLIGAIATLHEYLKFKAGTGTLGHVMVPAIFSLMFGWFGLSSFWRVRGKKKV